MSDKNQNRSGAAVKEAPARMTNEQLSDPANFLAEFEGPGEQSNAGLPFKDGFDGRAFQFHYFRYDEKEKFTGAGRHQGWVQVKLDGACGGVPFKEMFGDNTEGNTPWDDTGQYPKGQRITGKDGQPTRELYLFCRPIGAHYAQQRKLKEQSDSMFNPTQGKLAEQEQAINRFGPDGQPLVTVQPGSSITQQPMITSGEWATVVPQAAQTPAPGTPPNTLI
jgi:hypothetical protein